MLMMSSFLCATINLGRKKSTGMEPQEISPRSIHMQGIKSVLINVTENKLKRKWSHSVFRRRSLFGAFQCEGITSLKLNYGSIH